MLKFLFGKKKPVCNPNQTIQKLQDVSNMLEKKCNFLESQIDNLKKEAMILAKKNNKNKAIFYLKKSKLYEKQLTVSQSQKFNIEMQISVLSQNITNTQTIEALKSTRNILFEMETKNEPNKVAELMDNISDNIATSEEVGDIISKPLSNDIDEDDLTRELDEMNLIEQALEVPDISKLVKSLPLVPEKVEETEEDEIKKLEKMFN